MGTYGTQKHDAAAPCIGVRARTGEGADRFDHIAQPHCHFRCRDCGKVFDAAFFPQPYPKPARVGGFYVESCNIEFVGLCPACDKKL